MLLEINFTLVVFALSFLIFIYLLNLTLYRPVGNVIEKRTSLISNEYSKAKEHTEAANKLIENYTKKIKLAKQEAQHLIEQAVAASQKKKEEKISLLLTTLNNEKEIAVKQIEKEKEIVTKEVKSKLEILTDLITNKILGMENTLVGTH